MAAAYVLQRHNDANSQQCLLECNSSKKEGCSIKCKNKYEQYNLTLPSRMKEIDEFTVELKSSGFGARAFLLDKSDDSFKSPESIIIAFEGSNEIKDWTLNNLFPFTPIQLDEARVYTKLVSLYKAAHYKDAKLVVAGFSMAGAMAAHVKKHWEMKDENGRDIVDEAWAFNSSPRVGAVRWDKRDGIYLLANKYEFLQIIPWRKASVGAKPENTITNFDLVFSGPNYAHSRWVLTRQILHYADLHQYLSPAYPNYRLGNSDYKSEPMKALDSQAISQGRACHSTCLEKIQATGKCD